MARTTVTIEFAPSDRGEVMAAVADLAATRSGWVNFEPVVDPDDLPPPQGSFRLFSVVGRKVPLCTWTPPEPDKRGGGFVALGVQHGTGSRLVPQLKQLGLNVDARWRVLSDHPRRGLVVAVPPDDDQDAVVGWLLAVGEAVTDLPHRGWRAIVHRKS